MSQLSFRPARREDFAFCERLYFEGMGDIIRQLGLDMARERESFPQHWQVENTEVRIIMLGAEDIGWLKTWPTDDAIFLGELYVVGRLQRRGIGSHVLRALIDEAEGAQKAVVLEVVKINPARRLYERFGFTARGEGEYTIFMRRDFEGVDLNG